MELQLIQKLNQLNSDFYSRVAASFSNTRQAAWQGWDQVLPHLSSYAHEFCDAHQTQGLEHDQAARHQNGYPPLRIADIACGNLRFEKSLLENNIYPHGFDIHGFDNCPDLMAYGDLQGLLGNSRLSLHELDIVGELADAAYAGTDQAGRSILLKPQLTNPRAQKEEQDLNSSFSAVFKKFNVAVSFGFMHHIPSRKLKDEFVQQLISSVESHGLIVLSFWQFLNQDRLASKAHKTTDTARTQGVLTQEELSQFEAGDFLLPWQDVSGIYRYCHHFSDEEINSLCEAFAESLTLVDQFKADGRQGNLNSYCIFKVKSPNNDRKKKE